MDVNWKPCRVVHCYKVENNIAHIIGFDGIVRLNKTATIIWLMSNGKNTIKDILNELQRKFCTISENDLFHDVNTILEILNSRGILIKDWDPLLKDNVSLKENFK